MYCVRSPNRSNGAEEINPNYLFNPHPNQLSQIKGGRRAKRATAQGHSKMLDCNFSKIILVQQYNL